MPDYHSTAPGDRSFKMLESYIAQLERQNGDLQICIDQYRARYQLAEINLAIADELIVELRAVPLQTSLHIGSFDVLEAITA